MDPTEVAASIPITNTGKIKLALRKLPAGPSVSIPDKGSIIMLPGIYQVIALSVIIANIDYGINGIKVVPTNQSVKDARFAVYVNVSEK